MTALKISGLKIFLLGLLLPVFAVHCFCPAARARSEIACVKAADSRALGRAVDQYGADLKKFVVADTGLVHYKSWQKNRRRLDYFVRTIAKLDPSVYKAFDREQKLAFWLNAYNALAITSVLDHYPVRATVDEFPPDSIRQFNDGWEVLRFEVMGEPITLYDIEHDRLRTFCEPRIHFAVASASRDSALLQSQPFKAEGLPAKLQTLTEQFFKRKSCFFFDTANSTISVSRLFLWFTLDFAAQAGFAKNVFPPPKDEDIILNFIARYLSDDEKKALAEARAGGRLQFEYLPYDWSLNDADASKPASE